MSHFISLHLLSRRVLLAFFVFTLAVLTPLLVWAAIADDSAKLIADTDRAVQEFLDEKEAFDLAVTNGNNPTALSKLSDMEAAVAKFTAALDVGDANYRSYNSTIQASPEGVAFQATLTNRRDNVLPIYSGQLAQARTQVTSGGATDTDSRPPPGSESEEGVEVRPPPGSESEEADSATEAITNPVVFDNPLEFNTVESLLGKILVAIQGIIAVLAILFIVIGALIYITSGGNQQRTELAKNAIWAAVIGLALALAAPSFLKEIYTAIGGTPNAEVDQARSLTEIALNILKFLLSIIGILSIIMLVIGGIIYMLSAGDQTRTETAKKTVLYAVIGLVVALTSLVVVTQIVGILGAG